MSSVTTTCRFATAHRTAQHWTLLTQHLPRILPTTGTLCRSNDSRSPPVASRDMGSTIAARRHGRRSPHRRARHAKVSLPASRRFKALSTMIMAVSRRFLSRLCLRTREVGPGQVAIGDHRHVQGPIDAQRRIVVTQSIGTFGMIELRRLIKDLRIVSQRLVSVTDAGRDIQQRVILAHSSIAWYCP